MPTKDAASIATSFQREVARLKGARDAGEDAFTRAMLGEREVVLLYEVTFLNVFTSFESFQERLFFSCLEGESGLSSVRPLYEFRNQKQAEKLVLATERTPFLSWVKAPDTIGRATRFLAGGRPFSRLARRDRDWKLVSDATVLRNAIAHQSGPARREFAKLKGKLSVRRPGEYLRLLSGRETQHEAFSNALVRLSKALCATTDTVAKRYLLPERHFESGERVRGGSYTCLDCGTALHMAPGLRKLLPCGNCKAEPCVSCGRWPKSRFQRA